jgi:type I restriction enzyme S subunit
MSWPLKPLSELCLLAVDCVNKTAPVLEGPTPYKMIRTTNVKGGFIDTKTVRYVSEATFEQWTRRSRPQYGDVILTREAPVGEVGRCTFDETEQIFLGQRLFQYRPEPSLLDWNYLAYALQSPQVQSRLHGKSFGATVPHVKVGDAERLEIPVPPIETQQFIGESLAAYDDLIENNQRRIALLEESVQLLYRELQRASQSVGRSDGSSFDSKKLRLADICSHVRHPADPAKTDPETPYLSMEHMQSKSVSLDVWETAGKVTSSKLRFLRRDVLFGRIRPYFHKVGVAQVDGITSTDMIVVRPNSEELLPLVALAMSSDEFVAHAVATSNGTKMPRADWKVLKDWSILVPGNDGLGDFSARVLPVLDQLEALGGQNRHLKSARGSLLPKLLSGELNA